LPAVGSEKLFLMSRTNGKVSGYVVANSQRPDIAGLV
jgi:hypothetical protein